MALGKSRLGIFLSGIVAKGRFGRAQRFAADEQGAMYILAMFLFVTLLIVSGLSVDLMRYELQRTRLQATMDRALLSAAHPDQQTDRKKVVLDFFARSGLGDFIKAEDVYVKVEPDGTKVTASAHMDVSTPFLGAVGVEFLTAPAAGGAAKINQLTEISLVVDVSGSMAEPATTGRAKIVELRDAATQFSNLLLCNPNDATKSTDCTINHRKTSISLVPYSSQVTVGKNLMSKFNVQDAQTDSYCATFLDEDYKTPGIDPTQPLRQSAKYYTYGQSYINDRDWIDPYGWVEYSGSSPSWYHTLWSCYTANWREITPFEDSPTDMKTRINALGALGGTAIHVGMKWGSALLNHQTQPVISSLVADGLVHRDFAGRPFNPSSVASSKFLVLMTDGINSDVHRLKDGYRTGPSPFWKNSETSVLSIYDSENDIYHWRNRPSGAPATADHPYGDGSYRVCNWWGCSNKNEPGSASQMTYQQFWRAGYTWRVFEDYDFLGEPGVFTPNRTGYEGAGYSADTDGDGVYNVDQLLLEQCDAAKDAGIKIYTIELETPDTATDVMEKCASPSSKEDRKLYYKVEADSTLDLPGVFSKIAEDINRLRLIN